jgi:hypothetical protein
MKVSLKVVLTFVVSIITVFAINVIKDADSDYNMGLLAIIIFTGCIAGLITIWSKKPENLETGTNN